MHFPSFHNVISEAIATLRRFPLALLASFTAAIIVVFLSHDLWYIENSVLLHIFVTCIFGLPLFVSVVLYGEKKKWPYRFLLLGQAAVFIILIPYYFYFIYCEEQCHLVDALRIYLWNLSAYILFLFAPFIGSSEIKGFWQYIRHIVIRFVTTIFYSAVLYIGLALIYFTITFLFFQSNFYSGDYYFKIWVLVAGFFTIWFFLAGMPKDLNALEHEKEYPKSLKIFTQYILIPLVSLYMVVLYAYGATIIFQWELPIGGVTLPILIFSAVGIVASLFLVPFQATPENNWIKTFTKWFYILLIPLIFMLAIAIGVRVDEYGITENRYFVMVFGLWILGIVLYLLLSKRKNIQIIPMSLFFLIVVSSVGPLSAFSVSATSQMKRLETYLIKHHILVDGEIVKKGDDAIPPEDAKEMSAIIRYFHDFQGLSRFEKWFPKTFLNAQENKGVPRDFAKELSIPYYNEYEYDESTSKNFEFYFEDYPNEIYDVKGYDFVVRPLYGLSPGDTRYTYPFVAGGISYLAEVNFRKNLFIVSRDNAELMRFDLGNLIHSLIQEHGYQWREIPVEKMTTVSSGPNFSIKVIFKRMTGEEEKSGQISIREVHPVILIRATEP